MTERFQLKNSVHVDFRLKYSPYHRFIPEMRKYNPKPIRKTPQAVSRTRYSLCLSKNRPL
ncbi:hypothetical protein L6E24_03545 [Methanoplanus endosymbiosus]|uniref:Uncharacterized protein n=1 Tax=Methanoplanus endosymbiosus TaxID=33865 RepID=A0A9E7TKX6_9EURY|nr:hypothetical protein [Methanoplanus endosymbiosus]UUX93209.1 hypothetical protein L6E24_03545 [Methanoplanus endosymbiosus]